MCYQDGLQLSFGQSKLMKGDGTDGAAVLDLEESEEICIEVVAEQAWLGHVDKDLVLLIQLEHGTHVAAGGPVTILLLLAVALAMAL